MPQSHSQSHLISLATLLESAEARHSAIPAPPAPSADAREDSGLIDLVAMERRAREERAAAATRTPVPVFTSVLDVKRSSSTDADLAAATEGAKRRKKRLLIGAVGGGVALLITLIAVGLSGGNAPSPKVEAVAPIAAPPVAPPPPAPVVAPVADPPAAAPVAAAVSEPATASPAPKKRKARKAATHAPKPSNLMKVLSGGT